MYWECGPSLTHSVLGWTSLITGEDFPGEDGGGEAEEGVAVTELRRGQ